MRPLRFALTSIVLSAMVAAVALPADVHAEDRGQRIIKKFDRDGDGLVSRDEWQKSKRKFKKLDLNEDGQLSLKELRERFGGASATLNQDTPSQPGRTSPSSADGLPAGFAQPYFVDAHSQMAAALDPEDILPLMDKAGVWHTILSARNDRKPRDVANLAARYPRRLTGAVRSKGRAFNGNSPKFRKLLGKQLKAPVFKAMAEVLLYHAQKGRKAPEIKVSIDSEQARAILDACRERGWPFIAHYEFAAAGRERGDFMKAFEAAADANPDIAFVLIHMGQLDAGEVRRLVKAHANVYFMTSHANPLNSARHSGQPFIDMFEGEELGPDWKTLLSDYPDRFILAFDNVWARDWGRFYLDQAALWRKALASLPGGVAAAIAHGNAERLWKLPKP